MLSTIHFECLLVPEQLVGWPLSSEQCISSCDAHVAKLDVYLTPASC